MRNRIYLFLSLVLIQTGAWGQEVKVMSLQEAVQSAIDNNPQVRAAWYEYRASIEERAALEGQKLPQIDLTTTIGNESHHYKDNQSPRQTYNRYDARLTLSQMIYDGLATDSELSRLSLNRRARFYELISTSEEIALEAFRAYQDVRRYRLLSDLARENVDTHRSVYDLVNKRVEAGVGRSVDLEQVTGRLALSESNLMTETSNLHDVSARFLRIVGEMPAEKQSEFSNFTLALPKSAEEGLNKAYKTNPQLLASIELQKAAEKSVDVKKASNRPRVDFLMYSDYGNDINQIYGDTSNFTAEFVMTYNLYSGGSNGASIRQSAEQLSQTGEIRENTCRNMRQNYSIAYNDVFKLKGQLTFLDKHQQSISKAREAYRDQFDIGQRSLLDLLDTENEYFEARRAYLNGVYDLSYAEARVHASIGELMPALGIRKQDSSGLPDLYTNSVSASTVGCL